jgi:hypothetical protein
MMFDTNNHTLESVARAEKAANSGVLSRLGGAGMAVVVPEFGEFLAEFRLPDFGF